MQNEKFERIKKLEQAISDYQRRTFGERYHGATLSKLEIDDGMGVKIFNYLQNPKGMLLFHGSPGIGKTYFCSALTEWALCRFDSRRYHREEDLLRRLRLGISEGH